MKTKFTIALFAAISGLAAQQTGFEDGTRQLKGMHSRSLVSATGTLELFDSMRYEYNQKGLLTAEIKYVYNRTNSIWEQESVSVYAYDENGNQTLMIDSFMDVSKQNYNYKRTTTFNADNQQLVQIVYKWNKNNNIFQPSTRSTRKYDSNKWLIGTDFDNYHLPSGTWWLNGVSFNTNNSNGICTEILTQVYDSTLKVWRDNGKSKYALTSAGLVATLFYEMYSSGMLKPNYKKEYQYNPDSTIAMETTYTWNAGKSGYDNSTRLLLSYGAKKVVTIRVNEKWNTTSSKWEGTGKNTSFQNTHGWIDSYYVFSWDNNSGKWIKGSRYFNQVNANGYNQMQTVWNYKSSNDSFYKAVERRYSLNILNSAKMKETMKPDVKVFPNPALGVLNIRCNQPFVLEVFEPGGRMVYTSRSVGDLKLNRENCNLESGMYFLRMNFAGESKTTTVFWQ
ncbi:MAG: T9SS type A sorting domain-containing protein [Bacteroidetes bacterium]|nr:T9SS type A sorting domain-containing protein [Bacteroidota bacterium]